MRAEMAQLCEDTTKSLFEKQYVIRYTHAYMKEAASRKEYAKLALEGKFVGCIC